MSLDHTHQKMMTKTPSLVSPSLTMEEQLTISFISLNIRTRSGGMTGPFTKWWRMPYPQELVKSCTLARRTCPYLKDTKGQWWELMTTTGDRFRMTRTRLTWPTPYNVICQDSPKLRTTEAPPMIIQKYWNRPYRADKGPGIVLPPPSYQNHPLSRTF